MKVSAASATMADSDIENPASENSTSPSDAATSTMQIAMKIVEIRITRVKVLERPGARDRYDLSIIADSPSAGLLRTRAGTRSPGERSETRRHHSPDFAPLILATHPPTPPP